MRSICGTIIGGPGAETLGPFMGALFIYWGPGSEKWGPLIIGGLGPNSGSIHRNIIGVPS